METLSSNNSLNSIKNPSLSSINSNNKDSKCCIECKKPIKGKFVRALEGMFHLDCFRCMVNLHLLYIYLFIYKFFFFFYFNFFFFKKKKNSIINY